MKIRTLKDNVFDIEKNAIAQILIDAGLITIVPAFTPPAVPVPTQWMVGIDSRTGQKYIQGNHPIAQHADGSGTVRFIGKDAGKQIFYHCGKGEKVPAAIVEEFERPIPQPETE